MAKNTLKERKERLAKVLEEHLGEELTPELAEEIKGIFAARERISHKVDENGNVYCTYFEEYLPPEEFKVNAKGKFPSMSEEGKRLARMQKSAVNKAINEVMKSFKEGEITADEMADLLKTIDENSKVKFPKGTEKLPANYPYSLDDETADAE